MFDSIQKSSKFLMQIITLVSMANSMGTNKVFILAEGVIYVDHEEQRP